MTKTLITSDQVQHVAKLANIKLTPEEVQKLQPQLSEVLAYISQIGSVNTSKVSETCQVTSHNNVLREDKIDPARVLTQKQALANASATHQGYVVVAAVINK
ncbi:MAG: hypothetical protein ACD_83C00021G0002 [uncultured bacterium]|nr:MAG: hypothetical protein ACD_83C00021G0002 [uncultured bacterium]